MLEKTMKSNKCIILLRSFTLVCVLALLLPCIVVPTFATIDYNDYVSNIIVDGDNDIVTVSLPTSYAGWVAYQDLDELVGQGSGTEQWFSFSTYNQWQIICSFPSGGIDLSNIPNGTKVGFGVDLVIQRTSQMPYEQSYDEEISIIYLLKDGSYSYQRIGSSTKTISKYEQTYNINLTTVDYPLEIPNNADSMYLELKVRSHYGDAGSWNCKCTSKYFNMEMKISSLYRQQQLTGKTNVLLDEVNRQLEEQGKTMEDILNQQEQTNDKLDQLPGQIGDEMQGVIESGKEESKSEGNKFVDQILDALPDPSTDVLAALKSLTDATAYTGTDAVLPIPAIVLPGIDGLFPETEIWEGADFDFGDYLGFIPSSLLTLVQSLFTIAIVLYCVYELKGIISYCLTLRESKGG